METLWASLFVPLFSAPHSARADGAGRRGYGNTGWGGSRRPQEKGGCRAAPNQGQEGAGSQTRFLCWIISFQQFYCNYPENAAIYRVSQTAAVPGGRGEREREWAGRRREEVGGGDRKGKGIRQEEG